MGGSRSDRQGRPHSHGTDSILGEGRARSVDGGSLSHGGTGLSSRRQGDSASVRAITRVNAEQALKKRLLHREGRSRGGTRHIRVGRIWPRVRGCRFNVGRSETVLATLSVRIWRFHRSLVIQENLLAERSSDHVECTRRHVQVEKACEIVCGALVREIKRALRDAKVRSMNRRMLPKS